MATQFIIPNDVIDEMPIDPIKDEQFKGWTNSITFVELDGNLTDMRWYKNMNEINEEEEDD